MFKIPDGIIHEFKPVYENHRLQVSACNIFYQNIRLLNGRHKILDRNSYQEFYHGILNDIELETSPIDSFVPTDGTVEGGGLFMVNQLVPEYERIAKRVTLEDLYNTIPMTHEVHMKLKDNPNLLSTVVDDIYIYWCVFKYLDQIEKIRLNMFSNMTPIIEYVVNNISLKDLKEFKRSDKVNPDKYTKYCQDVIFNPEISMVHKFYLEPHGSIPSIDVVNLIMRLVTNIDLKSDIYIIIGLYMTMSFAMTDIANDKIDESPCVVYVRDVLANL